MPRPFKGSMTIEYMFSPEGENPERTFVVSVDYTVTLGHPGYISGPPELCYPPEGDEVEFDAPTISELLPDGSYADIPPDVAKFLLAKWDAAKHIEAAIEDAREAAEDRA